tara:strand:- start:492 stop:893 length:402 start_codon:yes stop_codon:yes gene_type:complete
MLNNKEVVSRIEEIINNHQLNASSFAAKIRVQRSAISHVLSGRNKPSLDFLMKIHDAFDEVNLEWLILGKSSTLSLDIENPSNRIITESTEVSDDIIPDTKIISPNLLKRVEAPKEIIYLYENGKFERFTPKN